MNRYRPLFFVFILVFISSCITSSKNSTVWNDTRKLYLPVKNNKIIYSQVVKDSSLTKDELFKKAKRWMYSVFDPKNLKTFDGKGYSQIVGTGFVAEVNDRKHSSKYTLFNREHCRTFAYTRYGVATRSFCRQGA